VYVERRFKLQTPLHPDNTDSERELSQPTRRAAKDIPIISIMDEPIVIDPELKHQQPVENPIRTSRYASSEEEKTPPAPRQTPEAMIGLDTPASPPAKPPVEDVSETTYPSEPGPAEEADVVAGVPSIPIAAEGVKEKKEILKFIDDVFSEGPMIVGLTLPSQEHLFSIGRDSS
jgi:hypothetical protein